MEELEKLMLLIAEGKTEEAQTLKDSIAGKIASLDSEVTKQESQKNDAIKTRDAAKLKTKSILSELGVSEDEDVIEAIKAIKSSKEDEKENDTVKDKTILQLKKEVQDANDTIKVNEETHKAEVLNAILDRDILSVLPKHKAKANAAVYIARTVKDQASYEDGEICFKNADGTKKRVDGRNATIDDIVKAMYQSEKDANESMFFDISVQQSGAGNDKIGGKPTSEGFMPGKTKPRLDM